MLNLKKCYYNEPTTPANNTQIGAGGISKDLKAKLRNILGWTQGTPVLK